MGEQQASWDFLADKVTVWSLCEDKVLWSPMANRGESSFPSLEGHRTAFAPCVVHEATTVTYNQANQRFKVAYSGVQDWHAVKSRTTTVTHW